MRECRIININDGRPEELTNGNFLFAQRYARMEREVEKYLNQGFEVKQMVPLYTPGDPGEGGYPFYRGGMVFYLEREVPEGMEEPPVGEDWFLRDDDPRLDWEEDSEADEWDEDSDEEDGEEDE